MFLCNVSQKLCAIDYIYSKFQLFVQCYVTFIYSLICIYLCKKKIHKTFFVVTLF